MRVARDRQVSEILAFLKQALRGDAVLIENLRCSPDDIVRGLIEDEPLYQDDKGELKAYATELPCLALYETGSTPLARPHAGERCTLDLYYALQTPAGDLDPISGRPITGQVKVRRWLKALWWRVCYWLRQHKLPPEQPTGKGQYDLMVAGGIDTLVVKKVDYFPAGKLSGLRASLEMIRAVPPYEVPAPGIVTLISWDAELYSTPSSLTVDGQVTLS